MHEPMSDVPNTSVRMCIFPKTARVESAAVAVETAISAAEYTIGRWLRKIKSKMDSTASKETAEITVISREAFEELL